MADDRGERGLARPEYDSMAGCFVRIFWMFVGNIALCLTAAAVYDSNGWSIADVIFWLIAGLLICARYIDILWFNGKTAENQPATLAHFRRYILLVLLGAAAVWAAARALGPGFD